jgi:hypothetical protein
MHFAHEGLLPNGLQALREGLDEEMERDPTVLIMGALSS